MSKGIWLAWPVLAVILVVTLHEQLYLQVRKLVMPGPTTIDGLVMSKLAAYAILIIGSGLAVWIVYRFLKARR